ncbi:TPA: hypothetical protein ACH0S9_001736, partial [Citrobacter werkmanii]
MKFISFLFFLYASFSFGEEVNCFSHTEANVLSNNFLSTLDERDYLGVVATDKLKSELHNYEGINKIDVIMKHSTEVTFKEGKRGDYQSSKNIIGKFPVNGCVWQISFATPQSIRKMCDDNGAAGYSFDFIKINGEIKLNNILELETLLPDGTFSCKS